MPPTPPTPQSNRHYASQRVKSRPCELCYRPIDTDDARFCSTCKPKAQRLSRE